MQAEDLGESAKEKRQDTRSREIFFFPEESCGKGMKHKGETEYAKVESSELD